MAETGSVAAKAAERRSNLEKALTEYVVLELDGRGVEVHSDGSWTEVGRVKAPSALTAIKSIVGTDENAKSGSYRAVPARSWHAPTVVTVEKKPVVNFR